jgi:hypothetical protein
MNHNAVNIIFPYYINIMWWALDIFFVYYMGDLVMSCAIVPYPFFFIYSHYRLFRYLSCCLFDIFPTCVYLY